MLYRAYQNQADLLSPARLAAQYMSKALWKDGTERTILRRMAAQFEVFSRMRLTHTRPDYGIHSVMVDGAEVAVHEETTLVSPFGTLLHFRKDTDAVHPPVLLAAPLSGHFATLLRETVRTLLRDHDVYLTDWHNARDVPLWHGGFGLDDYTRQLISFLEAVGPGVHMVAVCQPCVAALAATALMAEDDNPATPRSLTLMAGPVDCRINPTGVNTLATSKPIEWFEAQPHQPRAVAARRHDAARVPGLPAALGLHEHEPRAAQEAVRGHVQPPGRRRHREGRAPSAPSTTSTWP